MPVTSPVARTVAQPDSYARASSMTSVNNPLDSVVIDSLSQNCTGQPDDDRLTFRG
jgi:hypothetical protein